MGRWQAAAWTGLALASGLLSVAAWSGSPRPDPPPAPPPLPRPASPAERAQVQAAWGRLQDELHATTAALGAAPTTDELEGSGADGRPLLPSGLPDNPLRPGIASVSQRCPPQPQESDPVDWIYCPDSGEISPVGLDPAYKVSGKE